MQNTQTRQQQSDVLMQQFLQGETSAFETLVELWKSPLLTYFYYQVHEKMLAEDLAQDVLVKVYKSKNYRAQGQFSAWIYRIAQNILRDYLRRQKLAVPLIEEQPQWLELPSSQSEIGETLIQNEEAQGVYKTLAALPQEDREILIMSQIQALTYQEIADSFQVPLSVIKGKIYRSLRKFVRKFKQEENPYVH